MAKEKRAFKIPSVSEMDLAESQQRKEVPRSHFEERGGSIGEATSSSSLSSDGATTSGKGTPADAQLTQPQPPKYSPQAGGGSKFQECFSKLTESNQYSEIQKDLKHMRTEKPPQSLAAAAAAAPHLAQPPGKSSKNCIMVNPRQRGNPLLKSIQNVPFEYGDIIPDYVMGRTTCALFLSLRYHNLNPNYIHDRLQQLGQLFDLRVLLILVDIKDPQHALKELTKISIMANCTMILAWSSDEAGRYIETYKMFENKPADILMKTQDADPGSKLIDALTSVKSINRNDAVMLLTTFGTLENALKASKEELSFCTGMGQLKAGRLHAVLREAFVKPNKKTK